VAQVNSMKQLQSDGFFPDDPDKNKEFVVTRSESLGKEVRTATFSTQLSLLFKREMQVFSRAKIGLVFRFGIAAFITTLTGAIYLGVGSTSPLVPIVSKFLFFVVHVC